MLATSNGQPLTGQDSLYVSAVTDVNTSEPIIKIVNTDSVEQEK